MPKRKRKLTTTDQKMMALFIKQRKLQRQIALNLRDTQTQESKKAQYDAAIEKAYAHIKRYTQMKALALLDLENLHQKKNQLFEQQRGVYEQQQSIDRICILENFGDFCIATLTLKTYKDQIEGTYAHVNLRSVSKKMKTYTDQVFQFDSLKPQECNLQLKDRVCCLRMNSYKRSFVSKVGWDILNKFYYSSYFNLQYKTDFQNWLNTDKQVCKVVRLNQSFIFFVPLLYPNDDKTQDKFAQVFSVASYLEDRFRVERRRLFRKRLWKLA